ncbi:MAG: sterol-regulatory element binding protein (SREBP) site 2 protease [candidate division TM6 bacterium GW2011_GWE2_41_16]|nr:MAG: sterol-regulatory element binding protein (SREBP) site 2 protease [candidate division TM6 bacterium GW2011_GWE2_41_16]
MSTVVSILEKVLLSVGGYIILTTIVGALHARIAVWLGDRTPQLTGMTEFDPRAQFDFFGFLFFVLVQTGWKKELTLSPSMMFNLKARLRIQIFEPLLYLMCSFVCACGVLLISRQPMALVFGGSAQAFQALVPGLPQWLAVVGYALQTFSIFAISLSITAIFIMGIQFVISYFFHNAFSVSEGLSGNMTLPKLIFIGLGFAAFYFVVPLLFLPFLKGMYWLAYKLIGLFMHF